MQKTLYCTDKVDILKQQYLPDFCKHDYSYNDAFFVMQNVFAQDKIKDIATSCGDFAALAKNILAKALKQVTIIDETVQQLLIVSLLKNLQDAEKLTFFAKINNFDSLAKDILTFFQELKAQDVKPQDFYQAVSEFSTTEDLRSQDKELLIMYITYNKILEEKKFYDYNSLLKAAIRLLQEEKIKIEFKKIYICTYNVFSQLELDFVTQLSAFCKIDIAIDYSKGDSSAFAATKSTYQELLGLRFDAVFLTDEIKDNLVSLVSRAAFEPRRNFLQQTDAISFKVHAFRRQEVQDVAQSIKKHLKNGVKLDNIAIVIRSLSYYPALRREFVISGIPVCLPDVSRLSLQSLARFIDGFLMLDFDTRSGFSKMFSCFLFDEQINLAKIKKALEKAIFYNTEQAFSALNKAFYDDKEHLSFFASLKNLFFSFPKKTTVGEFERAIKNFLHEFDIVQKIGDKYKKSFIDIEQLKLLAACHKEILQCLEKITQDYKFTQEEDTLLTISQYQSLLTSYFKNTHVLLTKADFAAVKVLAANQLSCLNFDYVYILSLKDGEFPQKSKSSWLYSQEEQAHLCSLGLLKNVNLDRQLEQLFFYQALAMCEKQLYLSANISDGEVLSPFFEDVKELFINPTIQKRLPFEVVPKVNDLHNKEVLASWLLGNGYSDEMFLRSYLKEDFFERAFCDLPKRQDVYAGDLSNLQSKIGSIFVKGFSPSQLESYAFCKFKFLLESVLRIDSWSMAKEDIPRDIKGSFYHECLRIFLQKYVDKGFGNLSFEQLKENLCDVFSTLKDNYQNKVDFNKNYLTDYEFDKIIFYLEKWLEAEYDYQKKQSKGFVPSALEWSFGYDKDFTFETSFGDISVRGRIDRIDSDGENCFVTDYKSKNMPVKKAITTGLDLQIPIYFLAVDRFMGSCIGGNYFSVELASRDGGFWLDKAYDKIDFIGKSSKGQRDFSYWKKFFTDNISSLITGILSGCYQAKPADGKCPSYCIGQGICRYDKTLCGDEDNLQDE